MNFPLNIGFENLFSADFNAVIFSLFGMGLVFSGLIIISLYILVLPKILSFFQRSTITPEAGMPGENLENRDEKELMLAIATAFYLYQNFPEDNQKITWKSHGDVDSLWQISGRVQGMSQRSHVSRRFFPHR